MHAERLGENCVKNIAFDNHQFQMLDFDPIINQIPGLPSYNSNGGYLLPLTQGNVNRMKTIIPGCVATDTACIFEIADPADGFYISRNAIFIFGTLDPMDTFLQGTIHGPDAVGQEFGLKAPWQLIIPTA